MFLLGIASKKNEKQSSWDMKCIRRTMKSEILQKKASKEANKGKKSNFIVEWWDSLLEAKGNEMEDGNNEIVITWKDESFKQ